jgi:hypothetical protein
MTKKLAIIAALAVFSLGLSGCFQNPLESALETALEQEGIDADLNFDAEGVSLPADWPSEVPVPDGTIFSAFRADSIFTATVDVSSTEAVVAAVNTLQSRGYELVSETQQTGIASWSLDNGTNFVTYMIFSDSDVTTLTISVAPSG